MQRFQVSPLCPLSLTISSPLPGLSICHTPIRQGPISARLKMSFHGEKMEFVCEKSALLPAVFKEDFLFIYFLDCITCFFPSSLFASCQDRSICISPLKEFSDSCFQLFSLSGYDSNLPQATEKGSKIHLSLSAQLLVTADGWCSNSQLLLMGFPEGCTTGWCRLMILKSCFWHVYRVYLMSSLAGVGNTALTKGRANTLLIRPIDFFML